MTQLFIGIIIGIFVVWLVMRFKKRDSTPGNPNAETMRQRQKNLDKVLELARASGQISNDEVENMLGVSDATAERYLQELESMGKLIQIGKTGVKVIYKPKS